MINETKHIVIIQCMTYNQSHYIEDAMKGFIMQQTNFPFVTVVVDDASTDGEQQIIQHFLGKEFDLESSVYDENKDYIRIEANHKKNKKCTFVVVFLKYNHYKIKKQKTPYFKKWFDDAKYVALCEGDDYWTDPLKLQKQVDVLEQNPSISLCFHSVRILFQDGTFSNYFSNTTEPKTYSEKDIVKCNFISTQSVVFRNNKEIYDLKESITPMPFGDYVTWLLNTRFGTIYQLPDVMAVYRLGTGIWTTKSPFEQNIDSVYGYAKMLPLVVDKKNRIQFDLTIRNLIKEIKLEYNHIQSERNILMQSEEYKVGTLLLKPLKKIKYFINKILDIL